MGPTNSEKEAGEENGTDDLASAAYEELHTLAKRFLGGERRNHTLQPTELVHEAWMRIARSRSLDDEDRLHFLGLAATIMRRVLVDHARARLAERRAADRSTPLLEDPADDREPEHVDAIDRVLAQLEVRDPELGRLVELRFFGGLTVEETARAMGISPRTVKREWRVARAWLHGKLLEDDGGS